MDDQILLRIASEQRLPQPIFPATTRKKLRQNFREIVDVHILFESEQGFLLCDHDNKNFWMRQKNCRFARFSRKE